ncbi:VOC family protein [Kineosporia mesophila]|uniref:VOC family protein n=1 Tax=Kineosporia mesophila TaxID=566012 RepID=A0ABP6Z6K9_9ACTN|nr:VOC family protein [Kineosporia mesophila]MCD5352674.1 VOC family protein [Kineosporia mesophila]
MTSRIRHLTFDCADAWALGGFWKDVLGYTDHPENEPGDEEYLIIPGDGGPGLLFIPVPEGKSAKNRIHFDVVPQTGTRDEEVERLLGVGATQVSDHRRPDGTGWVVLADPEGNEFCVERSRAERSAV